MSASTKVTSVDKSPLDVLRVSSRPFADQKGVAVLRAPPRPPRIKKMFSVTLRGSKAVRSASRPLADKTALAVDIPVQANLNDPWPDLKARNFLKDFWVTFSYPKPGRLPFPAC